MEENKSIIPGVKDENDPAEKETAERRMRGDYSDEDRAVFSRWAQADNWAQLIDLNRKFLNGELPFTPYHLGCIFHETKALVPGLQRLHDFGILTIDSQPSKPAEPYSAIAGCIGREGWYAKKQRAFISFLVPSDMLIMDRLNLEDFLEELMVDEDLYVSVLYAKHGCHSQKCYERVRVMSSFPPGWCSEIYKNAKTFEALKDATECELPRIDTYCTCRLSAFNNEGMDETLPLMVHVLAKSWEEQDLAGLVEKAAERAEMYRTYAQ